MTHPFPARRSSDPPGANDVQDVDLVKARIAELQNQFPPDIRVVYPLDSTPFVRLSIEQVVHTIIEATVLVFLVMFLFLQNWRATLVPTIAIPWFLLGTFGVLEIGRATFRERVCQDVLFSR